MHNVSRLELMADHGELNKITAILNKTPNTTYTVIRNVMSHGVCGEDADSGVALENNYVIAFCPPDRLKVTLEAIRAVLDTFGGACFISDAQEVKSMRCVRQLED
jgi:hypothetical protein